MLPIDDPEGDGGMFPESALAMTLQQKFLLLLSMLGLALLGSLGAAWWSFGWLQREVASPFAETAMVMEELRLIKRSAEEIGRLIYDEGVDDARTAGAEATPGVRGPRGVPKFFAPDTAQAAMFFQQIGTAREVMERIDKSDLMTSRIGVTTWRNLRTRIEALESLGRQWIGGDALAAVDRAGVQGEAGLTCYTIHELVEATEKQVLANAQGAIRYGETVKFLLSILLLSVLTVGLLGGVLAVALLRRWVQQPVRALREAAARIAEGDLQHRVPVLQRDELGLLSAEVNHMAQMVQVMQDERIERERLAAIGEMVRRIVHNVRNPLAGIRGLAEVTRFDFEKGSPNRENMDLIVSTVDTFERWLSELLDATSPTSIHPRPADVQQWITGIVEIHRSQAAARAVMLTLDAARAPARATFDPKHMDHALSALVSNAIEATPESGHVWITAAAASNDPDAWEIEVADNGRGVPPEVLPRIFDAHYTTKRHGSGLGLAMTQQIIKGHSGRIGVQNGDPAHPERCGARFTIRLPLHASVPAAEGP